MAANAPVFPAIPQPTADINSLLQTVAAMKQTIETLVAQRGLVTVASPGTSTVKQKNNAAVLWGDLVSLGLVQTNLQQAVKVSTIGAVAHQWVAYIDTSGVPHLSQPAFVDVSGVAAPSQLPTPTTSNIGGVKAVNAVSHQWVVSIDTTGTPQLSQPAFTDISGTCQIAQGGTSSTSAGAARLNLGIISYHGYVDANVILTASDLPAAVLIAPLTAARTWTLPLANTVRQGDIFLIADNGGINGSNNLTIQSQGTDSLIGAAVSGNAFTLPTAFASIHLLSDGVGTWVLYRAYPPPSASLPTPTTSTLGGVKAVNAVTHKWVNAIDTTGTPQLTQPAFTDVSGVAAPSQLPTPTTSNIGGVKAVNAVSHQWVVSIDTTGTPQLSQPAFTDVSGTCAVNQGGTGGITAPQARANLGITGFSTHGDTNVTLTTSDMPNTQLNAPLTAPRTWTLPLASGVNAGDRLTFVDGGGISGTNTLTIQRQGTNGLLGVGVSGNAITLATQFASATFVSDGAANWFLAVLIH